MRKSVEQLPRLLKTLKRQAKLVKSNTLVLLLLVGNLNIICTAKNLSGKWNAPQLQRELEGECHMMRILQARNAKFLGNLWPMD